MMGDRVVQGKESEVKWKREKERGGKQDRYRDPTLDG